MASTTQQIAIAKRYAKALLDAASNKTEQNTLAKDMGVVASAIEKSADFQTFINGKFSKQDTVNSIKAIAENLKLHPLTQNALAIAAQAGRLNILPHMIEQFNGLVASGAGEQTAFVTVAQSLSAEQETALKANLEKATGSKIQLEITQDSTMLGGLKVQLGSKLLDASVAGRLEQMKRELMQKVA